jgi:hypothetical protein
VAYYQDEEGRGKKSVINNRRRKLVPEPEAAEALTASEAQVSEAMEASEEWKPEMVEHVRMVVSLIEGRWVGVEEILGMLDKKMRQHSIGRRGRIGHSVRRLNERPP